MLNAALALALMALLAPTPAATPAATPPAAATGTPPAARSKGAASKRISKKPKKSVAGPLRPVRIDCDKSDFTFGAHNASCIGNVVIERDDLRVTCDRLTADYDQNQRIKKLTCQGNVHMLQKAVPPRTEEREAWGDTAVFENDTSVLTVTGSPRARQGANTMRGQVVRVFVEEDRIVIDKPQMEIETTAAKGGLVQ